MGSPNTYNSGELKPLAASTARTTARAVTSAARVLTRNRCYVNLKFL